MNWLIIVVLVIGIALILYLRWRRRQAHRDVPQTSTWPSERSELAGQHEGVTMSLTAINSQNEGDSPPSVPAPVQTQAVIENTAYQTFCRDLEIYMKQKHGPHGMFSEAQGLSLFKTYERGLREIQELRDQRSQQMPMDLEHEVEDGEV